MSGPDGLEERTAYYDEAFSGAEDDRDYDQDLESDLMEVAEARLDSLCEVES